MASGYDPNEWARARKARIQRAEQVSFGAVLPPTRGHGSAAH